MQTDGLPYRIFEHTADLGMEIYGNDVADLFRNAACALADVLTDRSRVEGRESKEIAAEGNDREELFVNFLREIVALFNGDEWLLNECMIHSVDNTHLHATVTGEPFARERHTVEVEIKAVTYHHVEVRDTPQGWVGKVVCDV
jgi:SHS2 domain-containing protein